MCVRLAACKSKSGVLWQLWSARSRASKEKGEEDKSAILEFRSHLKVVCTGKKTSAWLWYTVSARQNASVPKLFIFDRLVCLVRLLHVDPHGITLLWRDAAVVQQEGSGRLLLLLRWTRSGQQVRRG